jgi:hypothetical protein
MSGRPNGRRKRFWSSQIEGFIEGLETFVLSKLRSDLTGDFESRTGSRELIRLG